MDIWSWLELKSLHSKLTDILEGLPENGVVLTDSAGFSMTGNDLRNSVSSLISHIQSVPQGTRIATLLPDMPMTAISLMALVHHVQILPINPALNESEILNIFLDAKVQTLLANKQDALAKSLASRANVPISTLSNTGELNLPIINGTSQSAGLVLLTSGSTGKPKRVPLTPEQLHLSAKRIAKSLKLGPTDRAIHALPMFHIGAIVDLLLAPLSAGGSVHFAGGMGAENLRDSTLAHKGTWLQLVPTMLARLQAQITASEADEMGRNLRFIRSVSSDLAPEKHKAAEDFFNQTPIIQMYGMTETAGQVTTNPLPPANRKYGSVGQAVDVEIRLQNEEIQVKGACVTAGYEGQETQADFTHDGWLKTGDLGRLDDDGFLFLTGRIKEMINRGGEKIPPHEIEHAALSYEHTIEAAAFARPHKTLGEDVGLAVTLNSDGTLEGLNTCLKDQLAAFKIPRKPLIINPLPRLGSGKIDRRALSEITFEDNKTEKANHEERTASLVALAWCTILPETEQDALTDTTDFFDVGGDSLSGAQFLFEVERLTKRSLPANLLYEAPEFGAFVKAVDAAPERNLVDATDPKHVFLQSRLAEWDAPAVQGVPFMRVLHADAPNAPLFWCAQEEDEYQLLAAAFTGNRPLYLMRSLFLMHGKDDTQNYAIAKDYAKAIHSLQPRGEIALGGFCEGAKIMRYTAEHLIALGRIPKVLISWDQWFETPLALPVLHLWSDERYEMYRQQHLFPERAIAVAHPSGYQVVRVGGIHTEVLTKGPITPFLTNIEDALTFGITGRPIQGPNVFDSETTATLSINGPRFFKRGKTTRFSVSIENSGSEVWHATEEYPLFVIAQIQNLDGFFVNSLAGRSKIECQIDPQKTTSIEISVAMPKDFLPIKLNFDLVDGASQHISKFNSKITSKYLFPMPF